MTDHSFLYSLHVTSLYIHILLYFILSLLVLLFFSKPKIPKIFLLFLFALFSLIRVVVLIRAVVLFCLFDFRAAIQKSKNIFLFICFFLALF